MRNFIPRLPAARAAVASLSLLIATPFVAPAQSPDEKAELESLRQQVRALDQQLRELSQRVAAREAPAASAAPPAAAPRPVASAGPGGFRLTAPDQHFDLRIRANVQADLRLFFNDAPGLNNDTFLLRRVRPSFEGTVAEKFAFRIMPDFAPANVALLDAYAIYRPSPTVNLLVGKTKSPFDLERLVSQTELLFVELAYPTTLEPNRDVGVQLFGTVADGRLDYAAAVLNSTADNGSSITNPDDRFEFAARLFAHPFAAAKDSPWRGLGLGVAYTQGRKRNSAPAVYRTNAQQSFSTWSANVRESGGHTRFSPQAYFYTGPFGLIGSYVSSAQDLVAGANAATLRQTAWFLAASWVLTGEDATYRGVTPAKNFAPGAGGWGAWEIALRHAVLAIDDDAFPLFANPLTSAREVASTTLGLNWYLNRHVKAVLNYEFSDFTGGPNGAVTSRDEHALLTRLQLRY